MTDNIKIAVDAMGGENSPEKILWMNKIPNENKSGNAPKNNAVHGNPR